MPNWCSNSVEFRHPDREQVERLEKAEKLFSEFVPTTDGEGWYEQNLNSWGTKWDVDQFDSDGIEYDEELKTNVIRLSFETAWSPPLNFYENMLKQGWDITAYYMEEGMNFCGKWEDGVDYQYEIPETAEEADDILPPDLNDRFGISDMLRDREEWDE